MNKFFFKTNKSDTNCKLNLSIKFVSKLIYTNLFLTISLLLFMFSIFAFIKQKQMEKVITPMYYDYFSPQKYINLFFSLVFIFSIGWYYFYLWNKISSDKSNNHQALVFISRTFWISLIPIFGSIYLFIWKQWNKNELINDQNKKNDLLHIVLLFLFINFFIIAITWLIYLLKGGIVHLKFTNPQFFLPSKYYLPTIFDLLIKTPINCLIGGIFDKRHDSILSITNPNIYLDDTHHANGFFLYVILLLGLNGIIELANSHNAFDVFVNLFITKTKNKQIIFIASSILTFFLCSLFFPMYEEMFIFCPILVKIFVFLGFDVLTGFFVVFYSTITGNFTSKIFFDQENKIFNGLNNDIIVVLILLLLISFWIIHYAIKTKSNLKSSYVYDLTLSTKNEFHFKVVNPISKKEKSTLSILFLTIIATISLKKFWQKQINWSFHSIYDENFHLFLVHEGSWSIDLALLLLVIAAVTISFTNSLSLTTAINIFFKNSKNIFTYAIASIFARSISHTLFQTGLFSLFNYKLSSLIKNFHSSLIILISFFVIFLQSFFIPYQSILRLIFFNSFIFPTFLSQTIYTFSYANGLMCLITPLVAIVYLKSINVSYSTYLKASWDFHLKILALFLLTFIVRLYAFEGLL